LAQCQRAHDRYRQCYLHLRHYFALAFESLLDQGGLESNLDSNSLAVRRIALIDGLQLQWLYGEEAVKIGRALTPRVGHA
jgi:hypothetical protein